MNDQPRRRRSRRFPQQGDEQPAAQAPRTTETNVLDAAEEHGDVEHTAQATASIEREDMREPMRPQTDRERADARAAEILGTGELLDHQAKYELPEGIEPDGWSYEWKAMSIAGKLNDQHINNLKQNGWEFVPASRHPELVGALAGTTKIIERDGQVLMERPKQITDMVRQRDRDRARQQVRSKEAQLKQAPPGTFERGTNPNAPVKISKHYEQIHLPRNES